MSLPDPTRNRHTQPRVTLPRDVIARGQAARPTGPPKPATAPPATVHELLIAAQQTQHTVREVLERLERLLERRPAQLASVQLTATAPKQAVNAAGVKSIGVYNPSGVLLYSSIGGGIAEPGRGSLTFPPKSLVVLPLAVGDTELQLGAAPGDLAAGDVLAWALLFSSVQPASVGVA